MSRGMRLWVSLAVGSVLMGCGAGDSGGSGTLSLRAGQSVSTAPECGVDLPACASGKSCLSFMLEGVSQVRCLDEAKVCTEILACSTGTTCAILESYPGQVVCSGRCEGSHCDDSVSSGPLP